MKELVLHVGATKTGSSAIQHFLLQNRAALEPLGVLYPDVGIAGNAHHIIAAAIHPSAWRMHQDAFAGKDRPAYFLQLVEQFKQAADESSAARAVMSSEYLWGQFHDAFYTPLQALAAAFEVRLLCYVRRQDDWLESTYAQSVKSGEGRSFREWLLRHLDQGPGFCHYDRILRQWERVVPAERIHVRVYDASNGVTDSVADLLDFLGIADRGTLALAAGSSNPSPLPHDTEMIRLINRSGLSEARKQNLRRVLLMGSAKKPPHAAFHYLSADETIQLLRRYEAGNAAVAKRYMGRADGQLFGRALPAPGEWPAWQGPSADECMARMLDLISHLLPEGGG